MNADTINIPDIPSIPQPKVSETASPIPLIANIIRIVHQAHFFPFNNPHPAYNIISPRINMKYPNIIPVKELLNPVGKEFFRVQITSNGVPGMIVDIPTIKAKTATMNTIITTNETPFGLFTI